MDERGARALEALALMVRQHCPEEEDGLVADSIAMSSNEAAILALAEYGYLEIIGNGRIFGRCTEAGKALIAKASGVSVGVAFAPKPKRSPIVRYKALEK